MEKAKDEKSGIKKMEKLKVSKKNLHIPIIQMEVFI